MNRRTALRLLQARRASLWVCGLLLALALIRQFREFPVPPVEQKLVDGETVLVRRVIDGDTVRLASGARVRLIVLNTPEIHTPGRQHSDQPADSLGLAATAWLRQRVEGRQVQLTYDRERFDRYERVLAYLWLDESLVNEELIRHGFSRAELRYPYRPDMKRRFQAAEAQARSHRTGMWQNAVE